MIHENKTDPQMKDLLENPITPDTTLVEYKGRGADRDLDLTIIQYAEERGLEYVGTGFCLISGTRDIKFNHAFSINEEIYLVDALADAGIEIEITTNE